MRTFNSALVATAVLISSYGSSYGQTPIFGDFGAPAWSRMYKYFETRLVGENIARDDSIFVMPTATNAAWDDPIQVLRLMEMYRWGDNMPSASWLYAVNSNKRISDGYRYFLNSAFLAAVNQDGTANEDLKNATRRSVEELDFTRAEYNSTVDSAEQAYEAYARRTPLPRRKSKAQFFKEQQWDTQIVAKRKRLEDAADTFSLVTSALVNPDIQMLKDAQIRFSNPKQRILLPPVREVLNDNDRWQSYYATYLNKDIFAFLRESNLQNQVINEQQLTSTYFEQTWRASVSVSFLGLFRVGGADAEQTKREEHIKKNTTRINISFRNIDTFDVTRGEWYSQNVIDKFASKLPRRQFIDIFGPNGQLEYVPKTLLVGRGMVFSIYADSQSLDYLYEHFHAGADAGFYVGYWKIGGGGEYSSTKEETKVYKYNDRIEFVDLSGRGKVLAMLAKHVAGSVPPPAPFVAMNVSAEALVDAKKKVRTLWAQSDALRSFVAADKEILLEQLGVQ